MSAKPCAGCPFKACAGCGYQGGPEGLVDTATAATAAGVEPATLRDWVRAGRLVPAVRRRGRAGNLYRLEDVFRARTSS